MADPFDHVAFAGRETLYQTSPLGEQRRLAEQELLALFPEISSLETGATAENLRHATRIQQLEALSDAWSFTVGEIGSVFAWAASVLLGQEQFEAAERLLGRSLVIWERVLGLDDPLVDKTLYDLALLNVQCGKYSEAQALFLRSIETRMYRKGADHPSTLLSLSGLAYVYARQKKILESEAVYQKALALCERELGLEHPLAIVLQYKLANLYLEEEDIFPRDALAEKMATAKQLLQGISATYTRQFGADHLNTARILHKLAQVHMALQEWERAETLLRSIRPSYEQHIGSEQPETMKMLYHLAFVSAAQQKWDGQTKALLQRAGMFYVNSREPDYEHALDIFTNLALIHMAQQEWEQAVVLLQRVRAWCEQILGPEHLDTGRILHALTQVYIAQQAWEQAETFCEQALAIYTRELGHTHQETLNCQQYLALLYEQLGHSIRAASLKQQIWQTLAEGPAGPKAIEGMSNLAELHIKQGSFDVAERLLQHALLLCKDYQEVGLIVLRRVLGNLAIIYQAQGRHEQAREFSARVAQIEEAIRGLLQETSEDPLYSKGGEDHK